MSDKIIYETNFMSKNLIVETEPNHSGTETIDIAKVDFKSGFSKTSLSKTLPAMIGYVQPLNGPTGYVFGLRPKKLSGSNPHEIQTITTETETQGNVSTNISIYNAIPHNTEEDFIISRKLIETKLREVKVDITIEVEQDIVNLFGDNFEELYHTFLDPTTNGKVDKVAKVFFEYATTQMVKKTNKDFTTYLDTIASPLGSVALTPTNIVNELSLILGEMQSKLIFKRGRVAGRFWVVCSTEVAAALSSISNITDKLSVSREITPSENSFITTIANMDIYVSNDVVAGSVYMGLLGGSSVSSIYYNPYNEYILKSDASAYTGQSNIFFRVRDSWCTNPTDSFNSTQPAAGTNTNVVESAASDFVVKAVVTIPTILI